MAVDVRHSRASSAKFPLHCITSNPPAAVCSAYTHTHKPLISIHNCVKKHNTLKHTFLHTDPRFVRPVSVHVCVSFLLSLAACFSQSFSPCFFFYIFKFFYEIFYVELATNDTLLPGVVLFGIVCMSLILRS